MLIAFQLYDSANIRFLNVLRKLIYHFVVKKDKN